MRWNCLVSFQYGNFLFIFFYRLAFARLVTRCVLFGEKCGNGNGKFSCGKMFLISYRASAFYGLLASMNNPAVFPRPPLHPFHSGTQIHGSWLDIEFHTWNWRTNRSRVQNFSQQDVVEVAGGRSTKSSRGFSKLLQEKMENFRKEVVINYFVRKKWKKCV